MSAEESSDLLVPLASFTCIAGGLQMKARLELCLMWELLSLCRAPAVDLLAAWDMSKSKKQTGKPFLGSAGTSKQKLDDKVMLLLREDKKHNRGAVEFGATNGKWFPAGSFCAQGD